MAKIIDVGVKNGDGGYVLRMGGVMVLLGVVGLACAFICQYCAARASQGFGTVVRRALYAHINKLSHAEIDRIGTPSLINRITGDVNQLQVAVACSSACGARPLPGDRRDSYGYDAGFQASR